MQDGRRSASYTDERPSYSLVKEGNVSCFLRVHEVALLPIVSSRLPCSDQDRSHCRNKQRSRRRFWSCSTSTGDRTVEHGLKSYWLEMRDDGLWLRQDGVDYLLSYTDFNTISRKKNGSSKHADQQRILVETSYGEYHLQLLTNHEREQWYYSLQYKRMMNDMRMALKVEDMPQQLKLDLMKACGNYQATGRICCGDTRDEFLQCIVEYIRDTRIPSQFMNVIVPMLTAALATRRPPDVVCQFLRKHMASIVNTDVQCHLDELIVNLFKLPLLNDHKCSQGEFELLISYCRAMHQHNKDEELRSLIEQLHSTGEHAACPFPIVFARLREIVIMSCTAAYKEDDELKKRDLLAVCGLIVEEVLRFDDWREKLALLKPRDFPDEAMSDECAGRWMKTFVRQLALDDRLGVRLCLTRPNSSHSADWLQHFRIGTPLCSSDDAELFCTLVQSLSRVEGNFKRVLANFASVTESLTILARRNNQCALQALVDLVRYKEIVNPTEVDQIKAVLRDGRHLNLLNQLESCLIVHALDDTDGPVETLRLPCGSTTEDLREALQKHTIDLRVVDLTSTTCGTDAMRMLANYPKITSVKLWATPVDDLGIRILCDKLNLTSLDLRDTNVTPTCFPYLGQMKDMEHLRMSCAQFKRHAFEYLARKLPNLITFEVDDLVDFDSATCRKVRLVGPPITVSADNTPVRHRRALYSKSMSFPL